MRLRLEYDCSPGFPTEKLRPQDAVQWVRYEDHAAEIERLKARIAELESDLEAFRLFVSDLRGELEDMMTRTKGTEEDDE